MYILYTTEGFLLVIDDVAGPLFDNIPDAEWAAQVWKRFIYDL